MPPPSVREAGRKAEGYEGLCESFLYCDRCDIPGEFCIMNDIRESYKQVVRDLKDAHTTIQNQQETIVNLRQLLEDVTADIIINEFLDSYDNMSAN